KASSLAIRYVQNMEKVKGQYLLINLGCMLEACLLQTHHVHLRNRHLPEAIDHCRRMLNYCETLSNVAIRQTLANELAELLLKTGARSHWKRPDIGLGKQSPSTYYGQSLFVPAEYEEEVLLLLMLNEVLVSQNVVLERSPDYYDSRLQSLNRVLLIQDLYTVALTPLRCHYVDHFERAMKFSFEVK